MSVTMKAAMIDSYKQDMPTLRQVPIPDIRPNDVLVKIVAASINPIDVKTKDGELKMLLKYDMPLILGSDMAGIVTKVGKRVTDYTAGDAVYARVQKNRIGTFAEYIAVDQGDIALKPRNMTFEEAASIPLVGLTSYQALHDIMQIKHGQKVLIQGGSGGIGVMAIQIAKAMGAYIATTTSQRNFGLVKSLGADYPIDYHTTNFADVLSDYDYVFDTRGGKALEDAFKIIKPGGKVVSIAGFPNARFGREYGLPLWKRLAFGSVTHNLTKLEKRSDAEYVFLFMKPSGTQLASLRDMAESGMIKPVSDRIVPFDDIQRALNESRSGHAVGKIILRMTDDSKRQRLAQSR